MTRSYDPSGPYGFPDSYEDEPPQDVPAFTSIRCLCGNVARPHATLTGRCQWCGAVLVAEERYQEMGRHWGAVAKARKAKQGGAT